MKKLFKRMGMIMALAIGFALSLGGSTMAATTPDLGVATGFAVLADTFNNTSVTTTINGNIGFTTFAGAAPVGTNANFIPAASAGAAQAAALLALNSAPNLACDVTFAVGAIDLGITHAPQHTGTVYGPGVYCIDGAMSIDTSPITLSGAGTYIFRSTGAFTTAAGMSVVLTNGASACDVFWNPSGLTIIGANNYFVGTVIPAVATVAQDITVLSTTLWTGRALAFASYVTIPNLNTTIAVPVCTVPAGTGTLNIIKTIINIGGGTAVPSDFIMNINTSTGVFVGSGLGTGSPGASYLLSSGVYTVTEAANSTYTTTYTHALLLNCSDISISSGGDETCTVLNTYIIPPSGGGGGGSLLIDVCLSGDYSTSYYDGICGVPTTITLSGEVAGLPSINIVKVADRITPFPYGGGDVTYTYVVTTLDDIPISDVVVTDDKCNTPALIGGDANRDHLLNPTEIRTYTCSTYISISTRNVATVVGDAEGVTVTDTDFANVVVGVPGLPKTGLVSSNSGSIAMLAGMLVALSTSLLVLLKKRKI